MYVCIYVCMYVSMFMKVCMEAYEWMDVYIHVGI
jgi:hypothetical protein